MPGRIEVVRRGHCCRGLVEHADGRTASRTQGVARGSRDPMLLDIQAELGRQAQRVCDDAKGRVISSDLDADAPACQGTLRIDAINDGNRQPQSSRDQTRLISGEQHAHDVMPG